MTITYSNHMPLKMIFTIFMEAVVTFTGVICHPQRPSAVSLSLKWRNATAAAGGARDTHAVNSSTEQRFIHAFSKLVTCKQ